MFPCARRGRAVGCSNALLLTLIVLCAACGDRREAPTAPANQRAVTLATARVLDTSDIASLSDRELLLTILDKLNALEARVEREAKLAEARLETAVEAVTGLSYAALVSHKAVPSNAVTPSRNAVFTVQGSICGSYEFAADAKIESALTLWGGAEGNLGGEALGNGAKGMVRGFATADTKIVPGGGAKLTFQLCGQVANGGLVVGNAMANAKGGIPGPPDGGGGGGGTSTAAQVLLENLLQSVSADQLAMAASRLQMNGSRLGTAIDAVSAFSLSDIPFGRGGAGTLLSVLPLPPDIGNALANPQSVLQRAPEAAQFAVSRLCDQTMFPGEFAQRALQACNLRGNVPQLSTMISIFGQLDGFAGNIGSLQSDLASACNALNAMRPARVTIAPIDVTFPLGIGVVRTFPGYNQPVFPGLGPIC